MFKRLQSILNERVELIPAKDFFMRPRSPNERNFFDMHPIEKISFSQPCEDDDLFQAKNMGDITANRPMDKKDNGEKYNFNQGYKMPVLFGKEGGGGEGGLLVKSESKRFKTKFKEIVLEQLKKNI